MGTSRTRLAQGLVPAVAVGMRPSVCWRWGLAVGDHSGGLTMGANSGAGRRTCAGETPSSSASASSSAVNWRACESEQQQHVVILVRNEGQSQLDQGNMWSS